MWAKQHDDFGWLHTLELPDPQCQIQVYKTAGGDYALVVYRDGDPCGGDPEYFDTLRDAKATGERIAKGNWQAYTLDATSSLR